jgi:hypothetical protein
VPQYIVNYNGYSLPYVRMTVEESPKYADDGFSLEGTQYNFIFTGFLLSNTTLGLATAINEARCALSQPRGFPFEIQWSDDGVTYNTFWNITPESQGDPQPGDFGDQAWGPLPGRFQITQMSGGRSCVYTWEVQCFRHNCFGEMCTLGTSDNNEILSFTIRQEHSIDVNGLTTRTIAGKIAVRSTLIYNPEQDKFLPADSYRYLINPPIPLNFVRTRQTFAQSADGRELSFTFVDEERLFVLPTPATNGHVSFTVRYEELGMIVRFTLNGTLEAPRSIQKSALLTLALTMVINRFVPASGGQLIYDQREFSEDMYANSISFSISAYCVGGSTVNTTGPTNVYSLLPGVNTFGAYPPSNSSGNQWPTTPYGGDANLQSGIVAYTPPQFDNCISLAGNANAAANASGVYIGTQVGMGGPSPSQTPVSSQNQGPSGAHLSAPWIGFHEEISYELDNGLVSFYPKMSGANPVFQQVRNPAVYVIQSGYARRYVANGADSDLLPTAQPPIWNGSTTPQAGIVKSAFIQPATPDPVGDGSSDLYTCHWRYVIELNSAVLSVSNMGINYPTDVRRTNAPVTALPNLTEIVWPAANSSGGSSG